MGSQRNGKGRAESEAVTSDGLRNDLPWRRKMLGARPTKKILYGANVGFVWYPRLPQWRERAPDLGRGAVCTGSAVASATLCWGASLGDAYIQGVWPKTDMRGGINLKELCCYECGFDAVPKWIAELPALEKIYLRERE